ncbi:MAG: hypothetical protein ACRD5H_04930, partial [Nitrososphaerales archaeon]
MKFIVRLALAGFLLAGSTEIYGQVGVVSIGQLEKSADAIIIGSVQPVSRDRLNVSARITVSRSLKGAIAAQSQVIAGWIAQSDHSASIVSQPRSISGMWFLKAKGQNSWEFLPVLSGDISLYNIHIPVSTDPVLSGFAYEPDARTTEKIINEIGSE